MVERTEFAGLNLENVDRALIARNTSLEALLFDRNLVGLGFRRACLSASSSIIASLADELLARSGSVAELMLISKGIYYGLQECFDVVLGLNLELNILATRRATVDQNQAQIEIPYASLDGAASTLVIGDTVASGSTVVAALAAVPEAFKLREVYLLTFAGSGLGVTRIGAYCRSRGIRLTAVFGLAAFGLGSNGFDLSFLHKDTVTDPIYRGRAFTQFDGRPVSAVGWDFGSQAQALEKYRNLCWLEAEYHGMHGHPALALELRPDDVCRWPEHVAMMG
jgi:hypothetical protein